MHFTPGRKKQRLIGHATQHGTTMKSHEVGSPPKMDAPMLAATRMHSYVIQDDTDNLTTRIPLTPNSKLASMVVQSATAWPSCSVNGFLRSSNTSCTTQGRTKHSMDQVNTHASDLRIEAYAYRCHQLAHRLLSFLKNMFPEPFSVACGVVWGFNGNTAITIGEGNRAQSRPAGCRSHTRHLRSDEAAAK